MNMMVRVCIFVKYCTIYKLTRWMHPAKYLVETRSVLTIYRDCIKLIHRMVEDPVKSAAAQKLLHKEFERHK